MVRFRCTRCQKKLKATDDQVGRKCRCTACGQLLTIPPSLESQPLTAGALATNLTCQACGQLFAITPDEAGTARRLFCPHCGQTLTGQSQSAAPPKDDPGQGGHVRAVACQRPVDVIEDAIPIYDEPPDRARRTPFAIERAYKPAQHLAIPRFTEEGALIRCPHCNEKVHLLETDYNRRIRCPSCQEGLLAVVAEPGKIPLDCPDCGLDMEIVERMSGQDISCPNCSVRIRVPFEPIMVLKAAKPAPQNSMDTATVVGLVIGGALAGASAGRRRCVSCGRPIRNPTDYCYQCQP